jgi:hypothetical protein
MTIAWTPFERLSIEGPTTEDDIRHMMALGRFSWEDALRALDEVRRREIFANSQYKVIRNKVPATAECTALIHFWIYRIDGRPVGSERYDDFMRIRDELVGPDHEAVEIYPRRSNEVNTGHAYHLWVLADAEHRFPLGCRYGRDVSEADKKAAPPLAGTGPVLPTHLGY